MASLNFLMDSLLAGTLLLPWEATLCRCDVQRRLACGNHSGLIANGIPGAGENRSLSRRNRYSPSVQNRVRLHPGIAFAFGRNPHEFAAAMAVLTGTDYFAVENIEGGKQRRCAVPFIVVALPLWQSRPQRKNRRSPI